MYNIAIYWDGEKALIQKREDMIKFMKDFPPGSWFSGVITPLGETNNTDQSRLYFTWCDILAKEYGWDSKQEMHEFFKKTFNDGGSTKGFTTKEWSNYLIKVQAWANSNGINLPQGGGG
jgi:hypothetical protein